MKTLNFFGGYVFFIYVALFCLSALWGCSDREDEVDVAGVDVILSEEFKWPSGTTGELWELTNADVAELLALNPPPDWGKTKDPELYNKYYFAQLLKQFGDIPEVRYVIAFLRKPGKNITREQAIAYSEANYRLFPNQKNFDALLEISSIPSQPQISPQRDGREWMKEDPAGYMKHIQELLLRQHGDIPEVHIYVRLELKRLLGKKLTDAEHEARDAAALYLKNLDDQHEDKPGDDN